MEARATWRVGELAALTGVSVRTLHHYDELGLLCPLARSEAGYRLYGEEEVRRLQQIRSLHGLGFSLKQIRGCLEDPAFSPLRLIDMHLAQVHQRMTLQQRLCDRLEAIRAQLERRHPVSADAFLTLTQAIVMTEKYYTPEQRKTLEARRQEIGQARIKDVETQAWPALLEEVQAALARGEDPQGPFAQDLAKRWHDLVEEFTGGDQGIETSLNTMHRNEEHIQGIDMATMRPLYAFIEKASKARAKK